MSISIKAFTFEAPGLARELKTPCGICPAFNPLSGLPHPKIEEVVGLWDTGATGTVVTADLAKRLNLKPIRKAVVYHANGQDIVNVYAINLFLPNQVALQFLTVTEGKLTGMDMLIGMDVISQGDFSISNAGGKTTFSFRMPSIRAIDFVEESKPQPTETGVMKSVGRNDRCPCGSGKKYKICHGKNK